ncbi:MAG: hypothetical protein WB554_12385 [Desulfomonilaceae bacterium]
MAGAENFSHSLIFPNSNSSNCAKPAAPNSGFGFLWFDSWWGEWKFQDDRIGVIANPVSFC